MEERIRPTRTGLFMMELLIAVGILTFCAAVCVGLFVRAETVSRESADLTRAVSLARSAAERFRAGEWEDVTAGYDRNWQAADSLQDAVYRLELRTRREAGYLSAQVTVLGPAGEPLLSWPLAALETAP